MANYRSILDVESVEQATEYMNVLVEDAGSLKKVPAGGMIGGSGGSNVAIWRDENFANAVNGITTTAAAITYNLSPVNMTLEEALEAFKSDEGLIVIGQWVSDSDGPVVEVSARSILCYNNSVFYLRVEFTSGNAYYYWSQEYGITTYDPYGVN